MKTRVYSNTPRSRAIRTSVVLALSVLPFAALLAQKENADVLADLEACVAIERSNARLACYDGVLGRPASPQAAAATPNASSSPVAEATAAAAPAPSAAAAAPEATASEAASRRTIVVKELRLRTPSSAVFITDSGQVWEQTGSGRGRYPEVPFEATIEEGSLGSTFLVSPAGGPRIRVVLRD
jgi:hypothetical protein